MKQGCVQPICVSGAEPYNHIMTGLRKSLPLLLALPLLSGCQPPNIDIESRFVDGQLQLSWSQDWGIIFSDLRTPCVFDAGLYPLDDMNYENAIWKIEPGGSSCEELSSATVGTTPDGWQEVASLTAEQGETYNFVIRSDHQYGEKEVTFGD